MGKRCRPDRRRPQRPQLLQRVVPILFCRGTAWVPTHRQGTTTLFNLVTVFLPLPVRFQWIQFSARKIMSLAA